MQLRHLFFVGLLGFAPMVGGIEWALGCFFSFSRETYRIAFFNPQLGVGPALSPFQYISGGEMTGEADPAQEDFQRNAAEWIAYLAEPMAVSEVLAVLYYSPKDSLLRWQEENALLWRFPGNRFLAALNQPRHAAAAQYFFLACRAEAAHFAAGQDPWTWPETTDQRNVMLAEVVVSAAQGLEQAPDAFLRQRYAYQLVVQLGYLERWEECQSIYRQYFSAHGNSILFPWAALHYAQALLATGDTITANCYFSRAFDGSASKKKRCLELFTPEELAASLVLVQSAHEKAVMLAMNTIQYPGRSLPILDSIVALAPDYPLLPLLWGREINKLEDWLLTPQVTFFGRNGNDASGQLNEERNLLLEPTVAALPQWSRDWHYLRAFRDHLERQFRQGRHADFLALAIAHLYSMDRQPAWARIFLKEVSTQAAPAIRLQVAVEQLLNLPQEKDLGTPLAQQEMVNGFAELATWSAAMPAKSRLYPKLLLYYSRLFQYRGDAVVAGLLYNRSRSIPTNAYSGTPYYQPMAYFEKYASAADLERLYNFLRLPPPTPLGQMLTQSLQPLEMAQLDDDAETVANPWRDDYRINQRATLPLPTPEQILELMGTLAFRNGDLASAANFFRQLPPDYWATTYVFSDYLILDPIPAPAAMPWRAEPLAAISKLGVVERMMQLEQRSRSVGPDQASAAFQLANAYFNTSYWGNCWMMFSYGKSVLEPFLTGAGYGEPYALPQRADHYAVYYGLSRAQAAYQRVLECDPAPDLEAKATLLLAYCEQFQQRWQRYQQQVPSPNLGKAELRSWYERYHQQPIYHELLAECPLLEDLWREQ